MSPSLPSLDLARRMILSKKWLISGMVVHCWISSLQADDLQVLGDEFNDSSTLSRWLRLNDVEGWNADQLETWDIDSSASGNMRMMPYTSSWFNQLRGILVHKNVSGDFIVTARLRVSSRNDPALPPNRTFSLAGVFVHRPIPSRIQSAPNPAPAGVPLWPPATGGYSTDWLPGQENYIFLSFGAAGNAGTRQYEVKTTMNSASQLYYSDRGVPASSEITLQLVIVGQTAVVLRRHPGGGWVVENRYLPGGGVRQEIPDFDLDANPATPPVYQVGITTYTDWPSVSGYSGGGPADQFYHNYSVINTANGFPNNPDLIADVDYVRFARPHPNLTEASLQALDVDFIYSQFNPFGGVPVTPTEPLTLLPATGAGQYLGDNANLPLGPDPVTWQQSTFGAQAGDPDAALDASWSGGFWPNLLAYLMGIDPTAPEAADAVPTIVEEDELISVSFTPDNSVAIYADLEIEMSGDLESWITVARKPAGAVDWIVEEAGAEIAVDPLGDGVTFRSAARAPGEAGRFLRFTARVP